MRYRRRHLLGTYQVNNMKKNTTLDPKKHLEPGLEIHSCEDLLETSQPRVPGDWRLSRSDKPRRTWRLSK